MKNLPYFYIINCPDGRKYAGVRYSKNCHPSDLWKTYYTSSKEIKYMIETYGKNAFKTDVRRTFHNKEDALIYEHKFLKKIDAVNNKLWVNKTNSKGIIPLYGELNHSKKPEVRQKISKSKKGKKRPDVSERLKSNHHMANEETRKKVSETRKNKFKNGELVPFWKDKKRNDISGENHPRYGKKFEKLGQVNSIEYTCPVCNKKGKGPGMKRYHFDNCKFKN